jgi:hypothetical protein
MKTMFWHNAPFICDSMLQKFYLFIYLKQFGLTLLAYPVSLHHMSLNPQTQDFF